MAAAPRQRATRHPPGGDVRIIGGRWRGRRLPVAAAEGLRPTADRIRETLFNWLQADIAGARCLDLFAGSGALGIEALSRGAAHCTFVDSNSAVLRGVAAALSRLEGADRADCHAQLATAFLATCRRPYDIVFLDPPFTADILPTLCAQLQDSPALGEDSLVYIESGQAPDTMALPPPWLPLRQKRAGAVHYALYRCHRKD